MNAGSMISSWSLTYDDGNANRWRFQGTGTSGSFEYSPVTPHQSSSGTYSGGEPARGELSTEQTARLWELISKVEQLASANQQRTKGSGMFQIVRDGNQSRFLVTSRRALEELESFLSSLRGNSLN